jgi:hypothetical protein
MIERLLLIRRFRGLIGQTVGILCDDGHPGGEISAVGWAGVTLTALDGDETFIRWRCVNGFEKGPAIEEIAERRVNDGNGAAALDPSEIERIVAAFDRSRP